MAEACHLCGGAAHSVVSERDRHGKALKTVVCKGCGIITNDPIPTAEQLVAFYRDDYRKEYKGAQYPRMRQVLRNFRRLEQHFRANRDVYSTRHKALDLGSGSGEFLFVARQLGIDAIGIEPNTDYAHYSRDVLEIPVTTGTLEEARFDSGSFDLIRLSHVLEHMREPITSLKVLREWLTDDGVLTIEVPDIARDARYRMRGQLFHFGHIYNFNPVTLRHTAARAGLMEVASTVDRHAGTTTAFFQRCEPFAFADDVLKENAGLMEAVMAEHNGRTVPVPPEGSALGRFFSQLRVRAGEVVASRGFADQRAIANHFGQRIVAAYR